MNFELTEETLEEGRVALHQLERQLNARNGGVNDNSSAASSKYQSTISDRKILDQVPRAARLNSRLESLGLTVEVFDSIVIIFFLITAVGIGRQRIVGRRWSCADVLHFYEAKRQTSDGTATKVASSSGTRKGGKSS